MKKTISTIAISIAILIVLAVTFLLAYYHINYQNDAILTESTAFELSTYPSERAQPDELVLIPVPKALDLQPGRVAIGSTVNFSAPASIERDLITGIIHQQTDLSVDENRPTVIRFREDADLPNQGYRLQIAPNGITIDYADQAGLFYSIITLRQIMDQSTSRNLPALTISDWPDMEIRGAMIDISRDKIPTMETLYELIDFLTLMKYNHLQLYVEGFSIEYPSFRELWEETETPVTGEDIVALTRYSRDRFIDLVPNQNALGHMAAWLATDRFSDLAECPDGFMLLGLIDNKATLDATDPRSMELVKQMTEDILPNFDSDFFNANLDEPFEIGQCKNKDLAEEIGTGQIYIDFVIELNEFIKEKGKRMMMWGDVVSKHPEIIPQIPDDVILIEWGYEDIHPFDANSRKYSEAGLEFMVAPGTSSWTTFTGRTDNMKLNIENAVGSGLNHGAMGMLLTDWGDFGHWQYWPVSSAPFVYGSALSWNFDSKDQLPLVPFLNRMIFNDEAGLMGDFVLDIGRYNQFEEYLMVNMTTTMQMFMFGLLDQVILNAIESKVQTGLLEFISTDDGLQTTIINRFENTKPYEVQTILDYTSELLSMLDHTEMNRPDSALIRDEYTNAIRMIQLGALSKKYVNLKRINSADENIELLLDMKSLADQIILEHERLWLTRNRPGGLDRSLNGFHSFNDQIESELDVMRSNPVSRFFKLNAEKVIASAAALYIKMQ